MTTEDMLADLLAHDYIERGTPSEEFEDEDFDVEEMMAKMAEAGGGDWEDLING